MPEQSKRFRLIEGGDTPRRYHKRGEAQQWVCARCDADRGVAGSTLERFEEILSPVFEDGKMVGGLKRRGWRCAACKTIVTVNEKQI